MALSGATCALHADALAAIICGRCGNFMCAACAAGDPTTLCPTCRQLVVPSVFPLGPTASLDALWGHTLDAWKRELGLLVAGTLVVAGLSLIGSLFGSAASNLSSVLFGLLGKGEVASVVGTAFGQLFSGVVTAVVEGVVLAGWYRILIDVLHGRKAELSRLFAFVERLPGMIAVQLLLFVLVTLPMLMLIGGVSGFVARSQGLSLGELKPDRFLQMLPQLLSQLVVPLSVAVVLGLVLTVVVLPLSLFALPEMVVGRCSPFEAVTRAWNLGKGQRGRLIGFSFISALVMMVGVLACLVGTLPAMPLASMLVLALFLALRNGSGLPPVQFD